MSDLNPAGERSQPRRGAASTPLGSGAKDRPGLDRPEEERPLPPAQPQNLRDRLAAAAGTITEEEWQAFFRTLKRNAVNNPAALMERWLRDDTAPEEIGWLREKIAAAADEIPEFDPNRPPPCSKCDGPSLKPVGGRARTNHTSSCEISDWHPVVKYDQFSEPYWTTERRPAPAAEG